MLRGLSRLLQSLGSSCRSSNVAANPIQGMSKECRSGMRSFASEGKGMLGSGLGSTTHILEEAAEARLQRLKVKADVGEEKPSILRTVLKLIGNTVMLAGAVSSVGSAYYYYKYDCKELATVIEETRTKEENQFPGSSIWVSVMEQYLSIRQGMEKQVKEYTDPTYHKLLPDMAPELRGRIKTLVLDLDDLLIHKEWTRKKGWTIYKRPGVQDFLFEMGQYFEVVIFTDEPSSYADPIITRLDQHRMIPYRLYRPETQYHNGKHVRDLSKLNREPSQVLMISAKPEAWEFQPENTLKLKPWDKDTKDTTLLDLIPFLQMIATRGVRDVRDVVKSYDHEEDVAKAFKLRMQQISETHKQPKQRGFLSLK